MNSRVKYKPRNMQEYVFSSDAVRDEIMQYVTADCMEPLLLHGPYGSGKTLLSELIPKAIDGEAVVVSQLNVELLNNPAETRKAIIRAPVIDKFFSNGQKRFYTVVQEMNFEVKASNAVRQCMDDMEGRELFIFTSNKVHSVDPGIRSRCREIEIVTAPPQRFLSRAKHILIQERVNISDDTLLDLLQAVYASENDNRAYYRILDSLVYRSRQGKPPRPFLRVV